MKPYNPLLAGRTEGDHFHIRMRMAREAAGLSVEDAADKIILTARHLKRIERGGGLHG